MATGASNQEIADALSISLQTVKSHVSNILTKLQAKSRHQAAEFGIKQGFIQRKTCLLYTSPSPRDRTRYRMPSSA